MNHVGQKELRVFHPPTSSPSLLLFLPSLDGVQAQGCSYRFRICSRQGEAASLGGRVSGGRTVIMFVRCASSFFSFFFLPHGPRPFERAGLRYSARGTAIPPIKFSRGELREARSPWGEAKVEPGRRAAPRSRSRAGMMIGEGEIPAECRTNGRI